jgi:NADH-quinone oxidoreductase subunit N
MNPADLRALLPILVTAASAVIVMLGIAVRRSHALTAGLALGGLAAAMGAVLLAWPSIPRQVTSLVIVDGYSLFFTGMISAAAFFVVMLSHGYLRKRRCKPEEFYVLVLLATTGAMVLVSSNHFVSLVLGLELLSVSLYALVAYVRDDGLDLEAGMKYLVLGGASSAFLLFGMALVYADTGSMDLPMIWRPATMAPAHSFLPFAGLAMILVGIGFKLGLVPFHLWTPDVYQGAPAPVSAFVATVSKGAVFALVLRSFAPMWSDGANGGLASLFSVLAVASMFTGNLLALLQNNIKRILAYSSIAHMGYLLVALVASGSLAAEAVTFYLLAYFITMLGAFGVVTVRSWGERDADRMEDYRGLAWREPWTAGVLTAMALSLAGIPLTAGFVGKFYVLFAGVSSSLRLLVLVMAVNSVIGLFYYLRIVVTLFRQAEGEASGAAAREVPVRREGVPLMAALALSALTVLLAGLGVYPGPVIELIRSLVAGIL